MHEELLVKVAFLDFVAKQNGWIAEIKKNENEDALVGFSLFIQETFDAIRKIPQPELEAVLQSKTSAKGNFAIDFWRCHQIIEENGILRIYKKTDD